MPWLKVSDTAADHEIPLNVLEDPEADDRLVNEAFGFVLRCAIKSAQQELDYVVPLGTAMAMAGSADRFRVLAAVAERAGYWSRMEMQFEDGRPARQVFKLVEDPDLFHMIPREERAWKNARQRDNRNKDLTAEVRLRDGDECRWCGVIVNWRDRRGGIGGTYDHQIPGQAAETAEDLVVSCNSCNSARKHALASETDFERRRRAVPEEPYYSEDSVAFLARRGHTVTPTSKKRMTLVAPSDVADSNAAEQAPQRESAPAPSSTAPVAPAAGSTPTATAAAPSAQRDTAGQERQRRATARDAGRPGAPAAAGTAQREQSDHGAGHERGQQLDAWFAERGMVTCSPLDEEEAEWAPEPPGEDGAEDTRQVPAGRQGGGAGCVGTGPGRVGAGLDGSGSGLDGPGRGGEPARKRKGRRRRGRRGGKGRGRKS